MVVPHNSTSSVVMWYYSIKLSRKALAKVFMFSEKYPCNRAFAMPSTAFITNFDLYPIGPAISIAIPISCIGFFRAIIKAIVRDFLPTP